VGFIREEQFKNRKEMLPRENLNPLGPVTLTPSGNSFSYFLQKVRGWAIR